MKFVLLLVALMTPLFASANEPVIRCGWIKEALGSMVMTDAQGRYVISGPNSGIFYDGSSGLITAPKIVVRASLESEPVLLYCACLRMTTFKHTDFMIPVAQVSHYSEKSLDACFKDAMLPTVEQVLTR